MTVHELYFIAVANQQWRFTSSQTDVTHQSQQWLSQPIHHGSAIEQSNDPLKMDTSFEVAAGSQLAELVLNPPLNHTPKISIWRNESGEVYKSIFAGHIVTGVYDEGWVKVELEPIYSEMQSTGLTESVTRQCRHHLGSRKCAASVVSVTAVIKRCQGNLVELTEAVPLQFQFGFLKHGSESRHIDAQPAGNQLVLMHPIDIPSNTSVQLWQGCDGTMATCHGRFNNALNFGGAQHLPVKNPYSGDPINR